MRALRSRTPSESEGPGLRVPQACGHDVAAGGAGALLPRHDRHRDEHDRRLRVHRRDHRGPRHPLAAEGRRSRAHPGVVALGAVDHVRVRGSTGAGATERRRAVARPRVGGDTGAAAARAARDLASRPAGPARRAVADGAARPAHERLGAVEERALVEGRLPVLDRTHLCRTRSFAARLGCSPFVRRGIPVMRCLLLFLSFSFSFAPALARAQAEPDTLPGVVQQPVVEVSTSRAGDRTPQAVSRLKRDELRQLDWGQDTPMAFATQPGAFAYSDAGNGIGYSYLTLRGFPQRRISVLVNGVPLNDPESHEVYWIDHPELLSATSEVQIQRGVGSALYGAAALGGSVNVETSPFGDAPHFSVAGGGGTFGTRRLVVEGASGPLTGGWSLYGRYARVETDGYRDDSWSRLCAYVLGARRVLGRQTFRVNLY